MPNSIKLKGLLIVTLLPALLLYSIFVIIPIFWSAFYGVFDWSGISESTFIVLDNYKEVLTSFIFWKSFKNNLILVFAFVFGLIFIVFGFLIFWSAYYGFFDWSGISESTFIGLDNYKEALTSSIFWKSFKNNLILVVASVFGQIPIALGFALLLRKNNMMQRFVRSAIFFPM